MIAISVATADDLPWIAALELRHYGPTRAVAAARLAEWYGANPSGFLVVREHEAHVTALPLKPPMLRALIDGTKTENDISAADIVSPRDRKSVRALYIESIIAEPIDVLGALLLTFNRHVARLAQPESMEEVVVHPLTCAGDRLVAKLGFERSARSEYFFAKYGDLVRRTAALRICLGLRRRAT